MNGGLDDNVVALEKMKYIEARGFSALLKVDKLEKDFDKLSEEYSVIKKEVKNIQFKFIEILAIFVAVIGFLFGFIKFSTLPQLGFIEIAGLIILFGAILITFMLVIHRLFTN